MASKYAHKNSSEFTRKLRETFAPTDVKVKWTSRNGKLYMMLESKTGDLDYRMTVFAKNFFEELIYVTSYGAYKATLRIVQPIEALEVV